MAKETLTPENFEERLIWIAIVWTYAFYLVGGLYVLGPVLAWILFFYLALKLFLQQDDLPPEKKIRIPFGVWVWIIAMLVMEVALIAGHFNFDLGMAKTIKSSIGWAKGWALMAIFPLLGCLQIRPQILYRAACVLCFQTILFFPIFFLAYLLNLPETPFVSPLQAIGGPGPEFFALSLYEIDPGSGTPRWRLFTPWAPALGFVANIYFIFALKETDPKWRWFGLVGSVMMCLISQSRLALVALVSVAMITWGLTRLTRPFLLFLIGFASTISGVFAPMMIQFADSFWEAFKAARADSTRVRNTLGRIALERWRNEAPIWGHGIVERGPHLVEYMPIGSHHSWYGLLFVKGLVGFLALAIPMVWSFLEMVVKGQASSIARVGLSIVLILFLYTFGENLEILAYLFWPGLVLLGIAFKEPLRNPFVRHHKEE